MIKSYRSKQRKIADEISTINAYKPLSSTITNTDDHQLYQQTLNLNTIKSIDKTSLKNDKKRMFIRATSN